jgi:hypothetical protein
MQWVLKHFSSINHLGEFVNLVETLLQPDVLLPTGIITLEDRHECKKNVPLSKQRNKLEFVPYPCPDHSGYRLHPRLADNAV